MSGGDFENYAETTTHALLFLHFASLPILHWPAPRQ